MYDSLCNFTNKLNQIKKQKINITISLVNFIERAIKNKSIGLNCNQKVDINNKINYFITNPNEKKLDKNDKNINTNTDFSMLYNNNNTISNDEIKKDRNNMFSISKKLENAFIFTDDEISLYESECESDENESETTPKSKNSLKDEYSNSENNEDEKDSFQVFERFTFKDKYMNSNIQFNNINNINNIHLVNNNISDLNNYPNPRNKSSRNGIFI